MTADTATLIGIICTGSLLLTAVVLNFKSLLDGSHPLLHL